jgi:WD40 repeat protein
LWDVVTQQQVAELKCDTGFPGWVTSIAFDSSGKYLALGSADSTVRVWDVASKQQVAELKGYKSNVTSVAFDSSRKYLASGSLDKSVVLWEVPETLDQQVSAIAGARALFTGVFSGEVADVKVHTSEVESVAFDRSGKYLASGCADNIVRVWDVSSMPMRQVAELKGHTDIVLSVAFDPSGKYLASGSYDNTVRVWDVASQQQVAELKGHMDDPGPGRYSKHGCEAAVFSVAFDPSGKYLASGSYDGTVTVWDMTTAPALDEDEPPADDDIEPELVPKLSRKSQGGRRSRKKNNRNKKRVKTLNKKKYRSSRTRRFRSKNKK